MMNPATLILSVLVVSTGTVVACAEGSASVSHPVYRETGSPERIAALRRAVEPVMALEEAKLVSLVPDRTGFRFMDCPNCEQGTQEGQLDWSIDDPHHVRCRFCRMRFPNEKFPEDKVMKVKNPVGVEVEYPYWEDPTGYKLLFSARAWREARVYLSAQAQTLGTLYQLTGDAVYARRAALILNEFAKHYPGFLVSRDWPHRPKGFALEPPYPTGGGKWGRWCYQEIPTNLVEAYDSIYSSGELERLSRETGDDVKQRIEEDFFRGAIRQDGFLGPMYTNASPSTYEGYAIVGRVLADPGLVHESVRRCREFFARQYFLDGFWSEGTVSYHQGTVNDMERVLECLRGYSDPAGYVDPIDKTRFDQLDLEQELPILARAQKISATTRYPDGRVVPFHDAWASLSRRRGRRGIERSTSTLLPGVGHAWLGRGEGEAGQTQAHLHFSGAYGHSQADNLNFAFFALGDELLPDLGYTHSRHRAWAGSTPGHNTVVIDEKEQYTSGSHGPSDGRLLAWETTHPTVQWVEASAERAYPELASLYRRGLLLVDAGGGNVYAVDLFRVEGGSQHDWLLRGSADRDSTGSVDVPLEPFGPNMLPGVDVRLPRNEGDRGSAEGRNVHYGYIQNVSSGHVSSDVTFTVTPAEADRAKVRTHLPGQGGATAFLGDAPSIRRADENDALLDTFRMPVFLLRSEKPSTLFAAVHEPYKTEPFIEEVTVQRPLDSARAPVALSIRHDGVTDHIIHRIDGEGGPLEAGQLQTDGEVAFVRERDGVTEKMILWGGTELRWGDQRITAAGNYDGTITGTLRKADEAAVDALVVTGTLPEGDALKGATVIATFGDGSTLGYPLERVEHEGNQTRLILGMDPGVSISEKSAKHLYFPGRTIPGAVTYAIRTSAEK